VHSGMRYAHGLPCVGTRSTRSLTDRGLVMLDGDLRPGNAIRGGR
jgi:hypothetical protein